WCTGARPWESWFPGSPGTGCPRSASERSFIFPTASSTGSTRRPSGRWTARRRRRSGEQRASPAASTSVAARPTSRRRPRLERSQVVSAAQRAVAAVEVGRRRAGRGTGIDAGATGSEAVVARAVAAIIDEPGVRAHRPERRGTGLQLVAPRIAEDQVVEEPVVAPGGAVLDDGGAAVVVDDVVRDQAVVDPGSVRAADQDSPVSVCEHRVAGDRRRLRGVVGV